MDTLRSSSRRIGMLAASGFGAVVVALWAWWPAGVALGLVFGVIATVLIGRAVHVAASSEPHDGELELADADGDDLWQDFRRLRVRLGDDWRDFSSAALLVTKAQTASTAVLQRDLRLTGQRSSQVLGLLEREGFVGPAQGTRPRAVLVERDAAGELRRLLHA